VSWVIAGGWHGSPMWLARSEQRGEQWEWVPERNNARRFHNHTEATLVANEVRGHCRAEEDA